ADAVGGPGGGGVVPGDAPSVDLWCTRGGHGATVRLYAVRCIAVCRTPCLCPAQRVSTVPDMEEIPPYAPNPAAYVYAEVADHLAVRIEAGRRGDPSAGALPPGARLPGERDLA